MHVSNRDDRGRPPRGRDCNVHNSPIATGHPATSSHFRTSNSIRASTIPIVGQTKSHVNFGAEATSEPRRTSGTPKEIVAPTDRRPSRFARRGPETSLQIGLSLLRAQYVRLVEIDTNRIGGEDHAIDVLRSSGAHDSAANIAKHSIRAT